MKTRTESMSWFTRALNQIDRLFLVVLLARDKRWMCRVPLRRSSCNDLLPRPLRGGDGPSGEGTCRAEQTRSAAPSRRRISKRGFVISGSWHGHYQIVQPSLDSFGPVRTGSITEFVRGQGCPGRRLPKPGYCTKQTAARFVNARFRRGSEVSAGAVGDSRQPRSRIRLQSRFRCAAPIIIPDLGSV